MSANSNGDISSMINNDKEGEIIGQAAEASLAVPAIHKDPDYDED